MKLIITICITLLLVTGVYAVCDSSMLTAQENTEMPWLYYWYYKISQSSYSYGDFQQANPEITSVAIGQQLCLPSLQDNYLHLKIEDYDSLWIAWQLHGAIRGYSFNQFAYTALTANGLTVDINQDPYDHNQRYMPIDLSSGVPFDQPFSEEYQNFLNTRNTEVLNSLSVTDTHIECLQCDIDTIITLEEQDKIDTLAAAYEKDGLYTKVIILDDSLFDRSSITAAGAASYLFKEEYPVVDRTDQILIIIFRRAFIITREYSSVSDEFIETLVAQKTLDLRDDKDLSHTIKSALIALYVEYSE